MPSQIAAAFQTQQRFLQLVFQQNTCSSFSFRISPLRSRYCHHSRDVFTEHHKDSRPIIKIDGFYFFRSDRMDGVAVLVTNRHLANEYVIQGDNQSLEQLLVKILRQPEKLYIGDLYHPPQLTYTQPPSCSIG